MEKNMEHEMETAMRFPKIGSPIWGALFEKGLSEIRVYFPHRRL